MVKINMQLEFSSVEDMLAMFAKKSEQPVEMKASQPAQKILGVVPTYLRILSDKEEDMAIARVGKHKTNAERRSTIISNLRKYNLTEEIAEKALERMVRMGKLIQITPNTYRRPTNMKGMPRAVRCARKQPATIQEFAPQIKQIDDLVSDVQASMYPRLEMDNDLLVLREDATHSLYNPSPQSIEEAMSKKYQKKD